MLYMSGYRTHMPHDFRDVRIVFIYSRWSLSYLFRYFVKGRELHTIGYTDGLLKVLAHTNAAIPLEDLKLAYHPERGEALKASIARPRNTLFAIISIIDPSSYIGPSRVDRNVGSGTRAPGEAGASFKGMPVSLFIGVNFCSQREE